MLHVLQTMRVCFFGSDVFSLCLLRKVGQCAVVTRSPKPRGRGMAVGDVPVAEFAAENGLELHRAEKPADFERVLDSGPYDLAVAVSFGKLIPAWFLEKVRYGGVNVHPSLLPMYRGSSPIQYALMNDDKIAGVLVQTLHPRRFDHGSVILQSEVEVTKDDNYASLETKLGELGAQMLKRTIDEHLFEGPFLDPPYAPSLAPRIDLRMQEIKWDMTSTQIRRRVDALGKVYAYIEGKKGREKVDFLDVEERTEKIPTGEFRLDGGVVVGTVDGSIRVNRLKWPCFGEEDAQTFMRRLGKRAGDVRRFLDLE